jgi:hypothetical protein
MAYPAGESESDALRLDFERRFAAPWSRLTRNCWHTANSDDALGLAEMPIERLADAPPVGTAAMRWSILCGRSVFGRVAG